MKAYEEIIARAVRKCDLAKVKEFIHASESFKRLNPHLFPVAGLSAAVREPTEGETLVNKPPGQKASLGCMECRKPVVTITAYRRRSLDSDNLSGGFKHLRDAIADWLGLDDHQDYIDWQYAEVLISKGNQGVSVKIEI